MNNAKYKLGKLDSLNIQLGWRFAGILDSNVLSLLIDYLDIDIEIMATIKQEDFVESIADAFQYISYYHPIDYINALGAAYKREQNPSAKDAIAQIITNSRMAAESHRPICQDTGVAIIFLKVGQNLRWSSEMSIQEMINEGVRRAI